MEGKRDDAPALLSSKTREANVAVAIASSSSPLQHLHHYHQHNTTKQAIPRGDELENHAKAVAEGMQALSWVVVKPAPRDFIENFVGAADFWGNKARGEGGIAVCGEGTGRKRESVWRTVMGWLVVVVVVFWRRSVCVHCPSVRRAGAKVIHVS